MVHRSDDAVWFSQSDAPEYRLLKIREELNMLPKNLPICRELILAEISRLQHEITVAVQNLVFRSSFQTETEAPSPPSEVVGKNSWVMSEPFIGFEDNAVFQSIPESRYTFTSMANISVESGTQDDSFHISSPIDGVDFIGEFQAECPKAPEPNTRTSMKILVPVKEYPGYNFIGRLIGPRGATMKEMQKESRCRIYIRGKGSLKFKDSSQEVVKACLPGNEHLNEPLHVLIEFDGPEAERERCMQRAEEMVSELLVPPARDEQDERKKQQLRELAILNGTFKENKTLQPCSNRRVTKSSAARSKGGRGRGGAGTPSDTRTSTPDSQPPRYALPPAVGAPEDGLDPAPVLETSAAEAGAGAFDTDRDDEAPLYAAPFVPAGEPLRPLDDSRAAPGARGAWAAPQRSVSLIIPGPGNLDAGNSDVGTKLGWSEDGGLGRVRPRTPSLPMVWPSTDSPAEQAAAASLSAAAAGRARWNPYASSTPPEGRGGQDDGDGQTMTVTSSDAAAAAGGVYLLF